MQLVPEKVSLLTSPYQFHQLWANPTPWDQCLGAAVMDSCLSSRESLTNRKGQCVSSFIRIMHGGNLLPESRNFFFLAFRGRWCVCNFCCIWHYLHRWDCIIYDAFDIGSLLRDEENTGQSEELSSSSSLFFIIYTPHWQEVTSNHQWVEQLHSRVLTHSMLRPKPHILSFMAQK